MNKEELKKIREFIEDLREKKREEERICENKTGLTEALEFLDSQDGHLVNLLKWAQIIDNMSLEANHYGQDMELVTKLRMIHAQMIREIGTRTVMIFGGEND